MPPVTRSSRRTAEKLGKSNEEKNEEEDWQIHSNSCLWRSEVELVVIIAEFLIGDYAFGTTANLNLASRMIRQETLPVLYETVCLDVVDSQDSPKSVEYSPGFRHTKFFFRFELDDRPFDHALPRLALMIDLGPLLQPGRGSPYSIPFDKCDIHVLKPLAARTAFAILKTPVVQYETNASMKFYPVASLGSVLLSPGAYLHRHAPKKLDSTRFDLALPMTRLEAPQSTQLEQDNLVQTAWELLKLWRSCDRPEYAERDVRDVLKKISDDAVAQRYLSARWPYGVLELTMTRSTLNSFLFAFAAAAEEFPDILSNAIEVKATELRNPADATNLLDRFADIYKQHITPDQQTQQSSFWRGVRRLVSFRIQDDYTEDKERNMTMPQL